MKKAKLEKENIGSLCLVLAHFYRSGVPFGDAFVLMAEDEPEKEMEQMLTFMAEKADEGFLLADIFRETKVFPEYVCGLLEVGEQTGRMEECLQALADYYTTRSNMEKRLKTALLYPMVLLAVMLAVVVLLLVWVLPVFNEVYQQLGSELTGLAGGLLLLGDFLRKWIPLFLGVAILILAIAYLAYTQDGFQKKVLGIWRKLRKRGSLEEQRSQARFIQALSLGMQSGMLPQEAVELAGKLVAKDAVFQEKCEKCLKGLDEGASLPTALMNAGLMGKSDGRLSEVARKAGKGEEVLTQIGERLLEESEQAWEERMARIEPTVIVLMSILIGAILCSVLLPLIHMIASIG